MSLAATLVMAASALVQGVPASAATAPVPVVATATARVSIIRLEAVGASGDASQTQRQSRIDGAGQTVEFE